MIYNPALTSCGGSLPQDIFPAGCSDGANHQELKP